ncbi:MAG TPA: hypothetical protein VFG76_08070, partial [Candidatus Polarisedimenticolia bacterium]|nr:hypothetical protein [Candidatus Polarisedimenticolia bacterium]
MQPPPPSRDIGPTSLGQQEDFGQGIERSAGPVSDSARVLLATLSRLYPFWPWLVLAVLAWFGWPELRQVDVQAVRHVLRDTGGGVLLALLCATGVNLAIFGLYDLAALGSLSRPPAVSSRWAIGVASFAWSNFLTVGPMAGPALRLSLYRPLGVDERRGRSALGMILAAFSLSLVAWCAVCLAPLPAFLESFPFRISMAAPMGLLAAGALAAFPRLKIAPPSVRAWEGSSLALAAVSMADWIVAWGVFHLALAGLDVRVDPSLSLTVFFIGQLIGLSTFVPGGLGAADAFWLVTLGGAAGGHDRVLAALILYRCVYYVLPWAITTLVLAGRPVRTGRRTGAFLRTAVASYAFLCGSVLLISAATPTLGARAGFLMRTAPLALIEFSHGASVALGFLLLVISRGLARGYRSSHRLALGLFLGGALTTFLKGLDFEEALLSLAAAVALLVFHQPFNRVGRLRPSGEFIFSVVVFTVVLFSAVGFGSLPEPPKVPEALGTFEYLAHEARFARGLVLLVAMGGVAAFH